jgi:hypothetical protein
MTHKNILSPSGDRRSFGGNTSERAAVAAKGFSFSGTVSQSVDQRRTTESRKLLWNIMGRVGVEPTTLGLKGHTPASRFLTASPDSLSFLPLVVSQLVDQSQAQSDRVAHMGAA